jgi:hypothetical protein
VLSGAVLASRSLTGAVRGCVGLWERVAGSPGAWGRATSGCAERANRASTLTIWAVFAACAVLRVGLIERQGLWADELFSLAMATGHSLEHPAAAAEPERGDFVELPRPAPPAAYSRYLRHERPAAGLARVVRATLRSDTSPPGYYLLLHGWTRALGTSDAALRLFSIGWSLAGFPLVWSLARQTGGRTAALPACLLWTFSPLCVFYSTEGRMYALLLFCTLALMDLTLRLRWVGSRPGLLALWVAAGTAGLLTHYFFAFVWAAALVWLASNPGRCRRGSLGAAAALTGLLVLPWYVHLPESLSSWRVTQHWLNQRPPEYTPVRTPLLIPWSYLSIRGIWGVSPTWDRINAAIFAALAVLVWRSGGRRAPAPGLWLLVLWIAGAWAGPVVFDLARGTYVSAFPRYALAGLPAALLLVAAGLGRLAPPARAGFLVAIVLACLIGDRRMYLNDARYMSPFRQVGAHLARRATASDLVLVHSIPSGAAGVARYMGRPGAPAGDAGFAPWVGQLGRRRVPDDLRVLTAGRRRIFLVTIHEVFEPAPEADWLRAHARLVDHLRLGVSSISEFEPLRGETFFDRSIESPAPTESDLPAPLTRRQAPAAPAPTAGRRRA